jgi:regulator of sigma E protease
MIITAITFIIVLGVLVLIHEFGHFIAAKKLGIKVEEFGFGFPPRVWGKKIGETLYSLNLLPIGGFVKVFGEEYHEENVTEAQGGYSAADRKRAFVYRPPWQKTIVICAGVVMNFLLGWALISYLFVQGVPTPTDRVIVEQIQPNSPAVSAGLKVGDVIETISKDNQSRSIKTVDDLIKATKDYGDQEVLLQYDRNGQKAQIRIMPRKNPPKNQGSLGVVITNFVTKKYPWYTAPYYGLKHATVITVTIVSELGKTLGKLVTGQGTNVEVTGPVGIAQYTGQARKAGTNALLELVALLSLNLAVINLLPFPALDGGRQVFILYEWVTKKRVNQNFERYMNMAGIIILLGLSAVITIFDVLKLFK